MNAPEQKPLLDVATQASFILLEEEAPREARKSGRLEPALFRKTLRPGVVLATMDFIVTPADNGGSILSTETGIEANDAASLRRFGIYWRLIHPGSDIIRRMWLRAIALRAEERGPVER